MPPDFEETNDICRFLEAALEAEKEKSKRRPAKKGAPPEHEQAQTWGCAVTGYFLLERGFQAVLRARGKEAERAPGLLPLFKKLSAEDRDVLQQYYDDFLKNAPEMESSPPEDGAPGQLDEFLDRLDSGQRDPRGVFSRRCLPQASVRLMHEAIFGCLRLVHSALPGYDGRPVQQYTHSWRLHYERRDKVEVWVLVHNYRPNWDQGKDRVEVLWGPDRYDRRDYLVFKGGEVSGPFFDTSYRIKGAGLQIVEKQKRFELFDVVEGIRGISPILAAEAEKRAAALDNLPASGRGPSRWRSFFRVKQGDA